MCVCAGLEMDWSCKTSGCTPEWSEGGVQKFKPHFDYAGTTNVCNSQAFIVDDTR